MAKGVTVIIAIILATALTLAAAGGAYFFFQKSQRTAQSLTESSHAALQTKLATCLKLINFNYNTLDDTAQLLVKNCGHSTITVGNDTLTMVMKFQEQDCTFTLNSYNCANCDQTIGVGAYVTLTLNGLNIYC